MCHISATVREVRATKWSVSGAQYCNDSWTVWLSGNLTVSYFYPHYFLKLFFNVVLCILFGSLFQPPGRPKRSIVAILAPKMTPKWSQSDNGRPLPNMHRHCRIAYRPPLGELHFHYFFRVRKQITKTRLIRGHFENVVPKCTQKWPSWDPDLMTNGSPFWIFFALGGPWSPIWAPSR